MGGLPATVLGPDEVLTRGLQVMPPPEVRRENAERARLADVIAERIASATSVHDVERLLTDELFEKPQEVEFLKLGGMVWTAERAAAAGAFDAYVATAVLGMTARSAAGDAEGATLDGPEDLQVLLYGHRLPRRVQGALHDGLLAQLAVLTLLLRGHALKDDVRAELERIAFEGSREYLRFLYGSVIRERGVVAPSLQDFLQQIGVTPMETNELDDLANACDRALISEHVRRVVGS